MEYHHIQPYYLICTIGMFNEEIIAAASSNGIKQNSRNEVLS